MSATLPQQPPVAGGAILATGMTAPTALAQPSAASSINARCEAVAKSREDDAAANGKDDELQKAVHDGTYANCVAWDNAHGGGE
jgi:hypothetical protein